MESNNRYKIINSIGYVFEKRKLIVTIPVGNLVVDETSLKDELKIMNLGAYAFLPCDAISIGEINKEALSQTLREKPSDAIIVIDKVLDASSGKELDSIFDTANKICNKSSLYLQKGYEIINAYEFSKNYQKYVHDIDIDLCTVLNVRKDKFNLKELLLEANERFSSLNSNLLIKLRQSKAVNFVYVANDKDNKSVDDMYKEIINNKALVAVPYMYWDEESFETIYTLNGDISIEDIYPNYEEDEEFINDEIFGDIVMEPGNVLSYLVSYDDGFINIKVISYTGIDQVGAELYEVVENGGKIIKEMKDYLKRFNK